jgi:hypothetical protein
VCVCVCVCVSVLGDEKWVLVQIAKVVVGCRIDGSELVVSYLELF